MNPDMVFMRNPSDTDYRGMTLSAKDAKEENEYWPDCAKFVGYVREDLYREAIEALRAVEFVGVTMQCPECVGPGPRNERGHLEGCQLARVLAKAKEMGL